MMMISRSGLVLGALLLASTLASAQGQAAIGAARGARAAVEHASEGQPSDAGKPRATEAPAAAQAPVASSPQAPPAPPAAAEPPAAAAQTPIPAEQAPIEPAGYTYDPGGRRDPFVSLVRRGTTTARGGGNAARPAGLGGLETGEITLRGTVRSREGFVAILQGADQKTYIVRAGDRLFDGTVRTISQNDMVILQQVNDPLSLEKQREVRKVLRQAEAN